MSRDYILENTCELFWLRGCKSVTMDDVAMENGISKRTLYETFEDKADLLDACILYQQHKLDLMLQEFRKKAKNVAELLVIVNEHHLKAFSGMKRNFLEELKKYYPEVYKKRVLDKREDNFRHTLAMLELGQKEGVFRINLDVNVSALMIVELASFLEGGKYFGLKDISPRNISRDTMLTYCRGLCTDKGIKIIDTYMNNINKE